MTQDLLPYYNEELTFLRSMAAGFARRHERVASRLWVEAGESVDPHVERLLQGVAFLNARVRHKLDDDFPELAQAMLGVIYPHYLRPIPSMGIVELQLHPTNVDFPGGYAVPAGTIVDTDPEPESGVRCRYRTGYPVTLWPLDVEVCELRRGRSNRRAVRPPTRRSRCSAFDCAISKAMPIRGMELGTLRFYLHAGPATNVYRLYELLFTKTLEICLAAGDGTENAAPLGPGALRGVGFLRSEGLLPWDDRSFLGYRLLSEYFAFPQKFLFVDLELHAARKVLAACAESLDIYFFLDTADENLQRHVSSATFRLGRHRSSISSTRRRNRSRWTSAAASIWWNPTRGMWPPMRSTRLIASR